MFNNQKVVVTMTSWSKRIGNCVKVIQSVLDNTVKPDIVFLNLSLEEFPNRLKDLPKDLVELSLKNPKVKIGWDYDLNALFQNEILISAENDELVDRKFIERQMSSIEGRQTLDMTMISVFYDAGINELRKVATRKAVSHWMEQKNLPKEMMFVELGFNGVFTFSREDFPNEINYIRIDGDDSNKYLFQKEHLWNIAAKRAKYEKLMFVDSDIAPLNDVDWFKEVYLALDKCLFTQGVRNIVYLDNNGRKIKQKESYTHCVALNHVPNIFKCFPGGVYCIHKSLLESIGYFNYLPLGGGDLMFMNELGYDESMTLPSKICKREYVQKIVDCHCTGKQKVGTLCIDVYHFYHGSFENRSYTQRDYMLITQYPWENKIWCDDDKGLLSWIKTNGYFYNAVKHMNTICDDANVASELMRPGIDYLRFIKYLNGVNGLSKPQIIRKIQDTISITRNGFQDDYHMNINTSNEFYTLNDKFNNIDEKIIVTMTSYPGRIHLVLNVIKLLFANTIRPDRLVLNLSTEEFPNKEKDLPKDLVAYEQQERNFEIYWVEHNTLPYKKTIPTLRRFPSDVIISVDDDINYPKNFIQTMWNYYIIYGKQCPITAGGSRWENDSFSHYGGFSLIKKEFFGDYLDDLYENLVLPNIKDFPFADPVITYASLLNHKRYKFTVGFDMRQIRMLTHDQNKSISRLGTNEYKKKMSNEISLLNKYIYDKYHKTYNDLFDAKINVNYTTYPLRDKYLYESLKSIQKQTLKPDNIFLWLSEDEYDKDNLPETIQRCLDEELLTQIKWLPKNIYCHKRHDCFYERNDEYNLDLDDDIRYRENFIEEIISDAKKYQNCITTLASNKMLYNGTTLVKKPVSQKVSIKNNYMGGRTCFPPYLIPIGYFYDEELNILRDTYVQKCDEAWIRALALKFNIMVNAIYSWKFYKFDTIEETQETALFNENKQMTKYGIREKERNFFNAIKIFNVDEIAKQIWPDIQIEQYNLLK